MKKQTYSLALVALSCSTIISGCSNHQQAVEDTRQKFNAARRQEIQNDPNLPPAAKAAALRDLDNREKSARRTAAQ